MKVGLPPSFSLTAKQKEVQALLSNDCRHNLIYGGGRSGKTFLLIYLIMLRAIKAPGSKHLIARKTFQSVKESVWFLTFEKLIDICFPDFKSRIKQNKDLWFQELPNGSRIFFGGLNDKERVDKILGNEYSTIYLNECSQIEWDAVGKVISRLAEKSDLVNKMYYDCNPTASNHWTYQLFHAGKQPDTGKLLNDSSEYQFMQMNPIDNVENIDSQYMKDLKNASDRVQKRFLYGEYATDTEVAVFKDEWLRTYRQIPSINYIVCSWDTAFKTKEYNDPSACTVWVVCDDGYYLLDIINERMDYPTLRKRIIDVAERYQANTVLIEDAGSGQSLLQDLQHSTRLPLASSGVGGYKGIGGAGSTRKIERAMYGASLFEQKKVFLPIVNDMVDEYRSQLLMFPLGEHDDMVDSTANFLCFAKDTLMYSRPDSVYELDDMEEDVYMGDIGDRNVITGY